MQSPSIARLLAHSLELDSTRLGALATLSTSPEDPNRQWAVGELAEWAVAARSLRSMVSQIDTRPGADDFAQALEEAAGLARSERKRARRLNVALGALVATCLFQALWLSWTITKAAPATLEAISLAERRADEADRRAAAVERRLEDLEADLRQTLDWHASALQRLQHPPK